MPASSNGIYCLPAVISERMEIEECKYLFCLLLQLKSGERYGPATFGTYCIGLTKLSPWSDKLARHQIIESSLGT
jgi:hypothetical protein